MVGRGLLKGLVKGSSCLTTSPLENDKLVKGLVKGSSLENDKLVKA